MDMGGQDLEIFILVYGMQLFNQNMKYDVSQIFVVNHIFLPHDMYSEVLSKY